MSRNDWIPLIGLAMVVAAATGIRLAQSSPRSEPVVSTPASPSLSPSAKAVSSTVMTADKTGSEGKWMTVKVLEPVFSEGITDEVATGCQPGFSGPDKAQQTVCLPDRLAVIATSETQNGLTACFCWFSGSALTLPSIERWQFCKGDRGEKFWINSQALEPP